MSSPDALKLESMSEEQKFDVVEKRSGFEIRRYSPYVLIEVDVAGDFMSAGNRAFGPLVSYISGSNATQEKFAMTAPVIQKSADEQTHKVSFVLPDGVSLENLPLPANSKVHLVNVPSHLAAVLEFRGSWNLDKFQAKSEELMQLVSKAKLSTVGSPYWARFDPPWMPGFLKRNETLIELKN